MEYFYLGILLFMSAIFSGLTIGSFSLSLSALEQKIKLGDKRALKVYKVRKNGNLLLCTLLLGNVAVNSTIAILLGDIATGVVAGLIATGLIVVLGEIMPQAFFARYALTLGSKTVWLAHLFIFILYPVAKPLSLFLDLMLGNEDPIIFSKQEISELIRFHEDSPHSNIDEDEERIILGALSYSEKQAYDIMTPKTVVYYLNRNYPLTEKLLKEIKEKGHSRIPIYDETPDNMIGILYTKDLIGLYGDENFLVENLVRKDKTIQVEWNLHLDHLLNLMVKKRVHLAFVFDEFGVFNGIVALEDIIEEILKVEIVDEQDKVADMQKLAKDRLKGRMA